jgi:hypothetical protein
MKTSNDIIALAELTGTDFYTTYLNNGNTITMLQYQEDYILLDNDMMFIHNNMELGGKYDKEAFAKGYKKGTLELFKKEGFKTEFKA